MFIALNNKNDKTYIIFSLLRKTVPDANIDTLKQISIYVGSSISSDFDINSSLELSYDKLNNCYICRLNDNRKIVFSGDLKQFGFTILRYDLKNKLVMSSKIFERIPNDLSTLSVYSEITSNNFGKYVVTFRPNDMCDETSKFGTINYYTNDEVDWVYEVSGRDNIDIDFDIVAKENGIYPFAEKSFFELSLEYKDTELDCYDGCLKNYLNMVDLLFNNINTCMNTNVLKKEKKL